MSSAAQQPDAAVVATAETVPGSAQEQAPAPVVQYTFAQKVVRKLKWLGRKGMNRVLTALMDHSPTAPLGLKAGPGSAQNEERTMGVQLWGMPADVLQQNLDQLALVTQAAEPNVARPVLITDQVVFQVARKAGFAIEYIMPAEQYERYRPHFAGSSPTWAEFQDLRLHQLRQDYVLEGMVLVGADDVWDAARWRKKLRLAKVSPVAVVRGGAARFVERLLMRLR